MMPTMHIRITKKNLGLLSLVGALIVASSHFVFAEELETTTEQFTFSSTKIPQKIGEAPEIISVYSSEFINRLGFNTLDELLRNTHGFDSRNIVLGGTPATRGVGNAALLMLDGTVLNGSVKFSV